MSAKNPKNSMIDTEDEIDAKLDFLIYNRNIKKEKSLSLKESLDKYDMENKLLLKNAKQEEDLIKINKYVNFTLNVTQPEEQNKYGEELINMIKLLKKNQKECQLPKLKYGSHLSDKEFLQLVNECVSYANYKLTKTNLEAIKTKLLTKSDILKGIFACGQIEKDLMQNALLTVLTSDKEEDQNDNLQILFKSEHCTYTPLINLDFIFGNKKSNLSIKELIETFSSPVYLYYYFETLSEFIPDFHKKIKNQEDLKKYIANYFQNHYIYFCKLPIRPNEVLALTIHTGNMYLKSDYLEEYYNEQDENSQLIIREKIILNIAHELTHALVREINEDMANNFFIKSKKINKEKNDQINFIDKFDLSPHPFDSNESGNVFDLNFFEKYYFDELFEKEANLFFGIKDINDINIYKNNLHSVIFQERNEGKKSGSVSKFKKLEKGRPHCKRPGSITMSELLKDNSIPKKDFEINEKEEAK